MITGKYTRGNEVNSRSKEIFIENLEVIFYSNPEVANIIHTQIIVTNIDT